jgi:hypothetical protein
MIVKSAIQTIDGKVWTGRRHHNILQTREELGLPEGYFRRGVQGFGKFYDREEAKIHFEQCGQVSFQEEGFLHERELFSEDLY